MEDRVEMSEVVLTRVLDHGEATVQVDIGRPVACSDGESDSYVPFRITGLLDDEVFMAGGVDGVQAMLFALGMIGDLLRGEGVTFLGGDPGFPVTECEPATYVATVRVPADPKLLA